jgi:4-oxalomesaconate tautomerase
MGGANPLTSKVAVVKKSMREGIDVDYLFLQIFVDRPIVTDQQNCGNILAGIGPFAIERGLIPACDGRTEVRIFMENTGQRAIATVETPGGEVRYDGAARIDGVPGTASPQRIVFQDTAGSTCGALLPTGHTVDLIDGVSVTMIDNGMPCVIISAEAMGISGTETPQELEGNEALREKLEAIRLKAGPMMNLGDVSEKSVPKMTMVSPAHHGGAIATRTFIPHRCHEAIGVLGAVSVATACLLDAGPAAEIAETGSGEERMLSIEHPGGEMTVVATLDVEGGLLRAGILRTARKLFDGVVFG